MLKKQDDLEKVKKKYPINFVFVFKKHFNNFNASFKKVNIRTSHHSSIVTFFEGM